MDHNPSVAAESPSSKNTITPTMSQSARSLLEIAGNAFDFPVAVAHRIGPAAPVAFLGAVARDAVDLAAPRFGLFEGTLGGGGRRTRCLRRRRGRGVGYGFGRLAHDIHSLMAMELRARGSSF